MGTLANSEVATRLPAQDLDRARAFYADKLGLTPSEERPGGLLYRCRSGTFVVFQSAGAASGDHTQMAFTVDDIEATVEELRGRGVTFEEYDFPGLKTVNGVAEIEGERGAWFKDPDGNIIGIVSE
jgi:catechol 2,3-dioxygenase-like lactoylglutathione lyase family enzyme